MRLISCLLILLFTPLFCHAEKFDLDYCRALVTVVGTDLSRNDSIPVPKKCLCGGTGKSGDGLGPCSCPDDCDGCTPSLDVPQKNVKPTDANSTTCRCLLTGECHCGEKCDCNKALLLDPLMPQLPKVDPVEVLLDSIDGHLARLVAIAEECRPKAVVDQTRIEPSRELLYFYTSNCPACNLVESNLFRKLRNTGWVIDGSQDAHIRTIFNGGQEFGIRGYPAFVEIVDGVASEPVYYSDSLTVWDIGRMRTGK